MCSVIVKWVMAWYQLAAKAKSGVLSKPSTTPDSSACRTSGTDIATADAPKARQLLRCTLDCWERIFLPLRSAREEIGNLLPIERFPVAE